MHVVTNQGTVHQCGENQGQHSQVECGLKGTKSIQNGKKASSGILYQRRAFHLHLCSPQTWCEDKATTGGQSVTEATFWWVTKFHLVYMALWGSAGPIHCNGPSFRASTKHSESFFLYFNIIAVLFWCTSCVNWPCPHYCLYAQESVYIAFSKKKKMNKKNIVPATAGATRLGSLALGLLMIDYYL